MNVSLFQRNETMKRPLLWPAVEPPKKDGLRSFCADSSKFRVADRSRQGSGTAFAHRFRRWLVVAWMRSGRGGGVMMMMVTSNITSEELLSPAGREAATARDSWGRRCLVVSGDGVFRSRAEAAADLSGCAVCSTPTDLPALSQAVESDFDVVVVDIARPLGDRVSGAVEIAEEFANRGSNLFVFCGAEAGMDEELWARQIGAWVFRPGEWPPTLGGVG